MFCLKSSNGFSVKVKFGRPSIFVLFLKRWGFEFAPASFSATSVSDYVMTSQDYKKKLNISGLDFFVLVLQISNSVDLNAYFSGFVEFKY